LTHKATPTPISAEVLALAGCTQGAVEALEQALLLGVAREG
jgi:hypothetical protein